MLSLLPTVVVFLLIIEPSLSSANNTTPTTSINNEPCPDIFSSNITKLNNCGRRGWVDEPNGRGTMDIIWSCCFTMFLCSWSSLCLNVPGPNDSQWKILWRKACLTALALLGPEFIFQIALSQWESARRSVEDFEALGVEGWTMTHAFYTDMGGFVLKTKDSEPFPINAKQLHYLITKGHVEFPKIDERLIADKNKLDGMLRLITILQTLWFVISLCGRASQQMAITTGELTTAAFIVCSVATTVCWYNKPADVQTPEIIETNTPLEQILAEAGDAANRQYRQTPLDFLTRKEWPWSLYWSNWTNILRKMRIIIQVHRRPVDRFQNTIVPEPSRLGYGLFLALTVIYASIFVCGWNYSFPTRTEQYLWRISSVAVLVCAFLFWAVGHFAFSVYPSLTRPFLESRRKGNGKVDEESPPNSTWHAFRQRASRVGARIRNNSIERDPELTIPLKAILPIYVLGVVYCHARTYIFLEDILELRSLPASAYSTVNWIDFAPHV
ncbi:hypothetical protein NUU61_009208 [Penicillium alfredii]|uniref:Uncharacterized protein n=1 Tax=Penicillium alfredii TaxID=1506179 RepID=A0A9W9JWP7_9EURO|nr:uncharacterized protein NUU61_009208 [Penicillium alfredii]KAJ5084629.1 hypothetical protein NUU61_009208 [Penicillium alfredii]